MSFDTLEESAASSKPIEFYDFADTSGLHERVTTAGVDLSYASHIYYSKPCERSELKLVENMKKNSMKFDLYRDCPFALQYVSGPLDGNAWVTCYKKELDDTEVRQFWFGAIKGLSFDENCIPTFTAEPRTSFVSQVGRRRRCQRVCDHDLYDAYCMVNKENYRVDGTIDSVSGLVITSTMFGTKADDWFAFGGEIWVNGIPRMIVAHTGNNITITRTLPGAVAGASFTAYAGCAHDPDACDDKSNKINYGGEEDLPERNPFTGDPIA